MAGIVRMEAVGLRYGAAAETLCDIDLALPQGGLALLTGPSGAGKSALAHLLMLQVRPSRGALRLFGEETTALTPAQLAVARRRIGMVFQDLRLPPTLGLADLLAMPLRIANRDEGMIAPLVAEALERAGCAGRDRISPAMLSDGERRGLALQRALITQPALIVVDGLFDGCDRATTEDLLDALLARHEQGAAVVIGGRDAGLFTRLPGALLLRLDRGRLGDPVGLMRHPPEIARLRA